MKLVSFRWIVLLVILVGCSHEASQRKYVLTGDVQGVDERAQEVTVRHGDIPGFMEAMTMPYHVNDPKALKQLHAGDRIKADLMVGENKFWLENIHVIGHSSGANPSH